MVGILVQLIISWLLVWWFERGNLNILGWKPNERRLIDFVLFLVIAALCSLSGFLLRMYVSEQRWRLNPEINSLIILEGSWFTLKSVLFEELIFRGALFYMLIKKIGASKAIIISSVAFGIYHWFSHELWGNPIQMAIEFVITGSMGLIFAYAYAKTGSLYVPIAIHLGWNLMQMVVFSGNTIGNQIFVEVLPRPIVTVSYFNFFVVMLFPMVSVLGINFILLRRYKEPSVNVNHL
jgi:uncharacterized protein